MSISLSEEHETQVQGYLRFAKLKRDQHVRETLSVIRDFKSEHLHAGDIYNYKEITALFGTMEAEVQQLVDKEIQHAYHTNALLVKILLNEAQAHGLNLIVDTATLENEFLLRQIASSEEAALSRPASDFVRRNTQLGKLGTFNTAAAPDAGTSKEKQQLEGDLATTRERLQKLQEQTTQYMRERTALNDQVASLTDELQQTKATLKALESSQSANLRKLQQDFSALSTEAAGAANTSSSEYKDLERQLHEQRGQLQQVRQKLADTEHALNESEQKLRQAHAALEGKLQESSQFLQMKKMMQSKSNEVVELRKRLHQYEPQSVPSADQPPLPAG